MESSGGATVDNWSETVEDLLHAGEVDQAISFLESTISNLEKELEKEELQIENGGKSSFSIANQLSTALHELSKLYFGKGFSLKGDQILSRALQIKQGKGGLSLMKESVSGAFSEAGASKNETSTSSVADHGFDAVSSNVHNDPEEGSDVDDWEALADCAPEELLSPEYLPEVSKLSLEDSKAQATKRRGRGTFSYKKQGLYSDSQSDVPAIDDSESTSVSHNEGPKKRDLLYGTRHVIALSGFSPSTKTTDLEKLLHKFKDQFMIRWVNDTNALAVFKTPAIALEACNSIQFPFPVRILDENDELLSSIPPKDLEPPRQRPQTSARAAQRMIAQSMGIKLPSSFGSSEHRKQEEARRKRIVSRQNMRDDAWGDDEN